MLRQDCLEPPLGQRGCPKSSLSLCKALGTSPLGSLSLSPGSSLDPKLSHSSCFLIHPALAKICPPQGGEYVGSTPASPPPLPSAAPETPELWTNQGCPALCSKTGQILAGTRGPHLFAHVFQRVWLNHHALRCWPGRPSWCPLPGHVQEQLSSLPSDRRATWGPSASSSPSVGSLMPQ